MSAKHRCLVCHHPGGVNRRVTATSKGGKEKQMHKKGCTHECHTPNLAYHIQHAGEQAAIQAPAPQSGVYTVVEMPTDAEMLMALAEAEMGSVARFPTLREPCPCPCNTRPQEGGWHKSICECQGRGWVPVQHDVVETVQSVIGNRWMANRSFAGLFSAVVDPKDEDAPWSPWCISLRQATLAAAVLMVAEEEQP